MPIKRSFGVLNDKEVEDVPGTVLLLPEYAVHSNVSATATSKDAVVDGREKRTADGIKLVPTPEDTPNDPLNWAAWRRNAVVLSLGLFCMIGGGMTPILAAGFHEVAHTFDVPVSKIAITTGLFMLGLGMGSVLLRPTAILLGQRPVYLVASLMALATSLWCAASSSYMSLVAARIFQGVSFSPVECLAPVTITEVFFLHERGYRLGIFTLLLLSGKNLMPLVSAVIIQGMGWRSVFWAMAVTIAVSLTLVFLFLPETSWDRSKQPVLSPEHGIPVMEDWEEEDSPTRPVPRWELLMSSNAHPLQDLSKLGVLPNVNNEEGNPAKDAVEGSDAKKNDVTVATTSIPPSQSSTPPTPSQAALYQRRGSQVAKSTDPSTQKSTTTQFEYVDSTPPNGARSNKKADYTEYWRTSPKKTYLESLAPFSRRVSSDSWLKVAVRPFVLFAYPAVLWGALVYSLSIGWLIVLSESVSDIYRNSHTYNFTALQVGLVYLSAFTGAVLGSALTGKLSDHLVRWMAKRNGGIFEPEFRLVMVIPVALCTVAGLMAFGWSVDARDSSIVPTVCFGIISFGCSLGSTTAINFCFDSYGQYAGEALVTLNFSKNIFHGLLFSLFFPEWLEKEGSKRVFIGLGLIQMCCLLFTIPMYIYGKRLRMWTVRCDFMRGL